jgi:hypothetical protein
VADEAIRTAMNTFRLTVGESEFGNLRFFVTSCVRSVQFRREMALSVDPSTSQVD